MTLFCQVPATATVILSGSLRLAEMGFMFGSTELTIAQVYMVRDFQVLTSIIRMTNAPEKTFFESRVPVALHLADTEVWHTRGQVLRYSD